MIYVYLGERLNKRIFVPADFNTGDVVIINIHINPSNDDMDLQYFTNLLDSLSLPTTDSNLLLGDLNIGNWNETQQRRQSLDYLLAQYDTRAHVLAGSAITRKSGKSLTKPDYSSYIEPMQKQVDWIALHTAATLLESWKATESKLHSDHCHITMSLPFAIPRIQGRFGFKAKPAFSASSKAQVAAYNGEVEASLLQITSNINQDVSVFVIIGEFYDKMNSYVDPLTKSIRNCARSHIPHVSAK